MEVAQLCSNVKGFRGIFSDDELPLRVRDGDCGIVNLEHGDQAGTHWVAWRCFVGVLQVLDSLGYSPDSVLIDMAQK